MTAAPGVARLTWAAGFAVAVGAAVATAHGLYEVARAAGAPTPIAALYPLITDGLALVAYATTTRLDATGRRYAWTIVVLAAGLSGLAQAAFLAGGVHAAPAWLRFGVGAWPATAAAIVAHLLYLLACATDPVVQPYEAYNPQPERPTVRSDAYVQLDAPLYGPSDDEPGPVQPPLDENSATAPAPARDRARAAARDHQDRHGDLPTVSALMKLADVARGTAGLALKELRAERPTLQIVPRNRTRTDR